MTVGIDMQLGARTFVVIHFEHAYARMRFAIGKKGEQGGVVQVAGPVQPDVGLRDVRVLNLVRFEHRVDIMAGLQRFRSWTRANHLSRA